jgi:WD40 repeat protein
VTWVTESALELLERALAGMTGKEQFDALAGTRQLWWRYCQQAIRLQADWSEARQRIAQLAEAYDPAEDDGRAFLEAADALAGIAEALRASTGGKAAADHQARLAAAVRCWNETRLLIRGQTGVMRLRLDIPVGQPGSGDLLRAVTAALDELPGGPGRAMVALIALLLAGPHVPERRKVTVPVLFDRPRQGGGSSGRLEVSELFAGPAGLYPDPRTMSFTRADDAEFTAGLTAAWNYAQSRIGSSGRRQGRCLVWRLVYESSHDTAFSISGGSLGAAFAIALREILAYPASRRPSWTWLRAKFRGLRPRCAVTGVIAGDQVLTAVSGLASKLEAAEARRWRLVAPDANRTAGIHIPAGVQVYWAADLARADRYARKWRPVRTSIALSAIAALVATGLTITRADQATLVANQATVQQHDINQSGVLASESQARSDANATVSQQESIAAWSLDPSPSDRAYYALLEDAASPQIAAFPVASGSLRDLTASRDGTMLATVSSAGAVQLWNVRTGRAIGRPITSNSGIVSATFSPDGTMLAIVGQESAAGDITLVRLWNVRTRQPISGPLGSSNSGFYSAAFSPDGTLLATASKSGAVQLWNVRTGQPIGRPLVSSNGGILDAPFSSDGTMLATDNGSGAVQLWNVRTRQLISKLQTDEDSGFPVGVLSPDGTMLCTSDGGSLQLWNTRTGQPVGGPFASGDIVSATFSPDGTMLAVLTGEIGGGNNSVRLWNTRTRQPLGGPLATSTNVITSVTFSPDSRLLAIVTGEGVAFSNGSVELWNAPTRQPAAAPLATSDGGADAAQFLNAGMLVTEQADGLIQVWNTTQAIDEPLSFPGGDGAQQAAFSPDGTTLATVNAVDAQLWTARTHQPISGPFDAGDGVNGTVAFSPDSTVLAVGKGYVPDGSVRLWNVRTRQPIGAPFGTGYNGVPAVAFSPSGAVLATVNGAGAVQLWNARTRQPIGGLLDAGTSVAVFSSDGSMLATVGGGPGPLRLWNARTGRPIGGPLPNSDGGAYTAAFSPVGTMLAVGNTDGTVQLWNARTRQPVDAPFSVSASYVRSLAFSPDGRILATGGTDGTVRLWDVATGQQIGSPIATSFPNVVSVTFSPDEKTLAIASNDATRITYQLQLWNVGYLVDPLARVCSLAGGFLTQAEWARYIGSNPTYRNVCAKVESPGPTITRRG